MNEIYFSVSLSDETQCNNKEFIFKKSLDSTCKTFKPLKTNFEEIKLITISKSTKM